MIETTKLYDGQIELEFDSARHQYRVVNKGRRYKVPSVTRITSIIDKSGPLVNWAINNTLDVCKGAIAPGTEYAEVYLEAIWATAKRASESIRREAAQRGKDRHAFIEGSLAAFGLSSEDSSQDDPSRAWIRANFRSVVAVERRVYSRRYRYSGTFDFLGKSEDALILVDWKTSKSIYPEFRLQTAAYQYAWEEEHPDQPIEGRYLVRIAEDGLIEPHYFPRSTYRLDFKAFKGALDLFNRIQQIEKSFKKSVIKEASEVSK